MTSPLNSSQEKALEFLSGQKNVFLTGAAGSGKSYLLQEFLKLRTSISYPILASTGSSAILIGGRTFHSFFGLGILEGGTQSTIDRALRNKHLLKRIKKTEGIIIDEISMISGKILSTAELIARKIRDNTRPWGGLRIIAVGDFAQLPPVNPFGNKKDWAFLDPVWELSEFQPIVLNQVFRTNDPIFLEVLNYVRDGEVHPRVIKFLSERTLSPPQNFDGTRIFSRRDDVEKYNLKRLSEINAPLEMCETIYSGKDSEIEKFRKNAPIPDLIQLKKGALVMLRQNDPEKRWVNGSLATVQKIEENLLHLKLHDGREIRVGTVDFKLLDADGNPVVSARNFPVNLAWAVTIHKSQGTTLDQTSVDIRRLWEPGQAYVALSRVRHPNHLWIEGWSPSSIIADQSVLEFHRNLFQFTQKQINLKNI